MLSLTSIIRWASSRTGSVEPAGSSWVVPDGKLSSSSRISTGWSHVSSPASMAAATAPSTYSLKAEPSASGWSAFSSATGTHSPPSLISARRKPVLGAASAMRRGQIGERLGRVGQLLGVEAEPVDEAVGVESELHLAPQQRSDEGRFELVRPAHLHVAGLPLTTAERRDRDDDLIIRHGVAEARR